MENRLCLNIKNLNWIDGTKDNPHDLCAHGVVELSVDGCSLLPKEGEEFTVSAAAIFLLRTLETDHTPESPVCEHLFPCCGMPFGVESSGDVVLAGCNYGVDFDVRSEGRKVHFQDRKGTEFFFAVSQWRHAVLSFSKSIYEFYAKSSPKQLADQYEVEAYRAFCDEWDRRDPNVEVEDLKWSD